MLDYLPTYLIGAEESGWQHAEAKGAKEAEDTTRQDTTGHDVAVFSRTRSGRESGGGKHPPLFLYRRTLLPCLDRCCHGTMGEDQDAVSTMRGSLQALLRLRLCSDSTRPDMLRLPSAQRSMSTSTSTSSARSHTPAIFPSPVSVCADARWARARQLDPRRHAGGLPGVWSGTARVYLRPRETLTARSLSLESPPNGAQAQSPTKTKLSRGRGPADRSPAAWGSTGSYSRCGLALRNVLEEAHQGPEFVCPSAQ